MKGNQLKKLRSRNSGFRKIAVKNLIPDPLNWHTHGADQRSALLSIFEEVGFVGALLVRPANDGSKNFYLIDGHERAGSIRQEYGPDQTVDCAVLNITDDEARKILASHDSIGSMGGVDQVKFDELMKSVEFDNEELDSLIRSALEFSQELIEDQQPGERKKTAAERTKSSGRSSDLSSVRLELSKKDKAKFEKISDFAKGHFNCKTAGKAVLTALEVWLKSESSYQHRKNT